MGLALREYSETVRALRQLRRHCEVAEQKLEAATVNVEPIKSSKVPKWASWALPDSDSYGCYKDYLDN